MPWPLMPSTPNVWIQSLDLTSLFFFFYQVPTNEPNVQPGLGNTVLSYSSALSPEALINPDNIQHGQEDRRLGSDLPR